MSLARIVQHSHSKAIRYLFKFSLLGGRYQLG